MASTPHFYFNNKDRDAWLEQCVQIVREAVLARRSGGCRTMPEALEQASLDLGISTTRATSLFYRQTLFVTREQWVALKAAAIDECNARAEMLRERTEAAHARRQQHELELGAVRGCSFSNSGRASATGDGTGYSERLTVGKLARAGHDGC